MLKSQPAGIDTRPLIAVRSNADIEQAKEDAAPSPNQPTIESDSALSGHIRRSWNRNKMAREKITQRLLKCLRARRGVYSQAELQAIAERGGMNVVWVDITEEKCKAAAAWVREVVMPIGDWPFDLSGSPVPDLPDAAKQAIIQKAAKEAQDTFVRASQAAGMAGQPGQQSGIMDLDEYRSMAYDISERMQEEVQQQYRDKATKAAERMAKKIQDFMAEGGWKESIDAFIEDFVCYPAAVLEGPVYEHANQLEWGAGFGPVVNRKPQMRWSWIDIFDVYPAQYATDCQIGDFIIRKRYTRRELFDCIGLQDYREDEIRKALAVYTSGHLEGWIWQEAERQRLQQESLYSWLSPEGVIDALHYWGSVPGWKLMSWGVRGMDNLDPVEEYEVDAILIGPYVIRCAVNRDPLKRRPYYNASFDKIPGSFWGRSIPDLCETAQKMINAAACSLADNMGWSSGPMAWVHVDRLADGENAIELIPGKMYQLKSDATQGVNPGIGTFKVDSNAEQLMLVIEKWSIKADDSTGVPRYTYGNERVGGAADTYSGLAMLMNNAAKGLRRSIQQIDLRVIEPSVYSAFINEMVYGKDNSVKADCVVVPRGATAMLVKEARNQSLMTAANITANPIDMQVIGAKGRAAILREVFKKALEIEPEGVIPTDDEIDQQAAQAMQQQQQMMQQQQQLEAAKIQAPIQAAQLTAESNQKIKGAELAAKKLESDRKNQPVDFEYGPNGEVTRAVRQQPKAEPATA